MFEYLNDWHDYLRIVLISICVWSIFVLIKRYRSSSPHWDERTLDFWYALLMWCLGGCGLFIQGIYLDRPFTPATILLASAVFVTGKMINKEGTWR